MGTPARRRRQTVRHHASTLRITLVASLIAALFAGVTAASAAASTFKAAGSARQVYVTGAKPGATLALFNAKGKRVATHKVNFLGGALFRNVNAGTGYHVKQLPNGPRSRALTVHGNGPAQWNPAIYKQPIKDDGYGYMTTRDGAKLAYRVWVPTELGGAEGTPGVTLP